MSIDLTQFGYSKEIADDMSARMVGKFIVSSHFKGKRKYRPDILGAVTAIDNQLGRDWYDFGFMDRVSDNVTLTFYRIENGTKAMAKTCFSVNCILDHSFNVIISNCRILKEMNEWTVASKVNYGH